MNHSKCLKQQWHLERLLSSLSPDYLELALKDRNMGSLKVTSLAKVTKSKLAEKPVPHCMPVTRSRKVQRSKNLMKHKKASKQYMKATKRKKELTRKD